MLLTHRYKLRPTRAQYAALDRLLEAQRLLYNAALVPKDLSERVHRCGCGLELDRDINAARNILDRALAARGRARPPRDANVGHRPVRRPATAVADAA